MKVLLLSLSDFVSSNKDTSFGGCMVVKHSSRFYRLDYNYAVSGEISNILFSNLFLSDYYVSL